MVENSSNSSSNDSVRDMYISPDFKEIMDGIKIMPNVTKEEARKILEELQESIDFVSNIDKIDIDNLVDRVIFTDGDMQLLYEDGEYYIVSATDSKKVRKKIRKQDAKDMYLEYFIKYQLNPLIAKSKDKKLMKSKIKQVNKETQTKKVEKGISTKTKEKSSLSKIQKDDKIKKKGKDDDSLSR